MIHKYQLALEDRPLRMLIDYEFGQLLEKEENLSDIEILLSDKTRKLADIRSELTNEKKKKQLLGRAIEQEEFDEMYEDISARVNKFLGVISVERPQWVLSKFFNNQYDSKIKLMFLNNEHRTELIDAAAHEYTHHVCNSNGIYVGQGCFSEGICRATQREIAKQYSIEENNIAFMLKITEYDVSELKSTYIYLAKRLGKPVKENLIAVEEIDSLEVSARLKSGAPTIHARGNTFYMLKELKEGNGFYNNVLRS